MQKRTVANRMPRNQKYPDPMRQAHEPLQDRLTAAEEIFFTWLMRVMAAAVLVGSAWIDDAPPLEFAAMIITCYVAVRIATQFRNLVSAAPFETRAWKTIFAIFAIVLLVLSFLVVITFVDQLARSVVS